MDLNTRGILTHINVGNTSQGLPCFSFFLSMLLNSMDLSSDPASITFLFQGPEIRNPLRSGSG